MALAEERTHIDKLVEKAAQDLAETEGRKLENARKLAAIQQARIARAARQKWSEKWLICPHPLPRIRLPQPLRLRPN